MSISTRDEAEIMKIKLSVERLRSGTVYVRPSGQLGTCGFYPKAWQLGIVSMGQSPISAFLECNKNWHKSDIEG